MTEKYRWIMGAVVAAIMLATLGGFVVKQTGWFLQGGQGGENTRRAESVQVSLSGRVVEVTGSVLAIVASGQKGPYSDSAKEKQVKLTINQKTRFEKTVFSKSGIPTRQTIKGLAVKKNDIVSVDVLLGKEGALTAALIIVSPRSDEKSEIPTNGYTGGTVINGTVDSLKDNGFLVKTENGENLSVTLDKNSNILLASQGQQPKESAAADIIVGEKISVMGVRQTSGEFVARQIMCVK